MASFPPTSLSLSLDTLLSSHNYFSPPLSFPHKLTPFTLKSSSLPSPPPTTPFLSPTSLQLHHTLSNFHVTHDLPHGSLHIRPMQTEEIDQTVRLLAESFAESVWMAETYVNLFAFLVKQYVVERRSLVPHAVMLVGFYKEKKGGGEVVVEEEEEELACTVEVSFDAVGANVAPPTPVPPKSCPYICNMTVKKAFRRRGIGWHLLKSCEELISQMKAKRKVYLHCRMIDTVPFQMYRKAGYNVVKKDSILIRFTLQRRKYLMCKELPALDESQSGISESVNHAIG